MDSDMVIHREWSQFPLELLDLIVQRVVSISDFIRFRSVCKSWRSAAHPNKLRPQPPLFLLPYNAFNPDRYIFSVATRRVHRISLSQLVGKRILNSARGWLLLVDLETKQLSLLNPVTLAQVRLPPNPNFRRPIHHGCLFYDMFADDFLVVIYGVPSVERISLCKVGDESWSVFASNLEDEYWSTTYHKGKFFGVTGDLLYMHDPSISSCGQFITAGSFRDIIEHSMWEFEIYIVSVDNELVLIYNPVLGNKVYSLYKLDYDGHQLKWCKVQFEDYAMFRHGNQHTAFCVKDFPEYKKNYVYSDWRAHGYHIEDHYRPVVGILDWKDGTSNFMACGWERPDDFNELGLWITLSFW